ncbi:uncharacterized protein LOC118171885 [Oxyura jamaicensis]|uniref:uncharacterized protein LOC118171885 n=1 Tax=Oxyura jamaicensis TaxID=8884 RepID=UPI0015A7254A|nr:uncharacterized protein LOC118171885 [Oxyura jamaicensis]
MDGPGFFSYNQMGMHGETMDTYPREMTSEADREILNAPWQKSACGNTTSRTEALNHDVLERLEKVEKELSETRVWRNNVEAQLQFLKNCNRQSTVSDLSKMQETSKLDPPYNQQQESSWVAFPGKVTQKELEENEEYQRMKERVKQLEARNHDLLSKMMSMHKQSEDMNDPSRLSAVLEWYEMVRLRDWEKCRISSTNMTYKNGRTIIQKLFDACEKYIEKRKNDIFNVLDISSSNYAYKSQEFANYKQELTPIVTKLLRNAYCQHYSDFYKKITKQACVTLENDTQKQFAQQCCRVYCLMLLQEPPVKAVWHTQEILPQYVEHVDRKDFEHCKKVELLWPILKSGEDVIVKGVVWDLK